MKKDIKYRITKCYMIEVIDKDGKELKSDFSFTLYRDTKKKAEQMVKEYKESVSKDR